MAAITPVCDFNQDARAFKLKKKKKNELQSSLKNIIILI